MTGYKNTSSIPVISRYKPDMSDGDLEDFALQLRRDAVELTYYSGTKSSHIGGELSSAEIIAVLYGAFLKLRPEEPEWPGRDILVMSKGHCSGVLYPAMAWRGYFSRDMLWNEFNRARGLLQEHCNLHLPGIEAATGSLGMGLANGCGYAWAMKHDKEDGRRVYVLLGDGECTEGQTWEGIGLGAQLKLDNLIAIVDYNKYIISSTTYDVMDLEPFEDRWKDFNWYVQRINGHDIGALRGALEKAKETSTAPGKPRVIICDTVKGKGIGFMEKDAFHWHAGHLDDALREQCLKELGL
ncbi:MAG: transketolase [Treponema sp.]|nr:transketolase [Treponema sp.]